MVVGVRVEPESPTGSALAAQLRFILDPKTLSWQRD